VPLGRVAGIRVGMHWSVLVLVILIGWLLGAQVLPAMTPGQPTVAYWAVAVPYAAAYRSPRSRCGPSAGSPSSAASRRPPGLTRWPSLSSSPWILLYPQP
jgi:hypothetical protein